MHALEWLFVLALVLYSLVIWYHKLKQKLEPWMVMLFGIALTADISGTIFLCVAESVRWVWNLHTIFGLISLLIMAAHFTWAVMSIKGVGKSESYFNRFSLYAWCLWLVAFFSGIPH